MKKNDYDNNITVSLIRRENAAQLLKLLKINKKWKMIIQALQAAPSNIKLFSTILSKMMQPTNNLGNRLHP